MTEKKGNPCPMCNGMGFIFGGWGDPPKLRCLPCNGTGQRPIQRGVAASRSAARLDRIIQGQAARVRRLPHQPTDEQMSSGADTDD